MSFLIIDLQSVSALNWELQKTKEKLYKISNMFEAHCRLAEKIILKDKRLLRVSEFQTNYFKCKIVDLNETISDLSGMDDSIMEDMDADAFE